MDKGSILAKINEKGYTPMTMGEMAQAWEIPREERFILDELLEELVQEGQIFLTKKQRYLSMAEKGLIAGRISRNAKGFAFFRDAATGEEYFIPPKGLKDATDRDIVLVRPMKHTKNSMGKSLEAQVEKIIRRGTVTFVGEVSYLRGQRILIPKDRKVPGRYAYQGEPQDAGELIYAKILRYPIGKSLGVAQAIRPVREMDEAELAMEEIIARYGLATAFPEAALSEADAVPQKVTEEDSQGRRDLRDLYLVTIDGEDARDFDDAVSLEVQGDVFHLGVHIADVSHYVREGSPLDHEALNRTTSVYFPDRVLPMLPLPLSNGICSLNEGEDRCAMTCMMDFNKKGELLSYEIFPSLIHSRRRMTYSTVAAILKRREEPEKMAEIMKYVDRFSWYEAMAELSNILMKRREKRGAVFFDFPEMKIITDEQGHPVRLDKRMRNQAESLIEEFMLAANETVAEHLYWLHAPCIYRVHEEPPYEGVETFNAIGAPYGLKLRTDADGKVHPRQYQEVIGKIKGSLMEDMLLSQLLRSMSHARYDIEALGHFGLSAIYYCHFTSPIRRYPDLVVHRMLKRYGEQKHPGEQELVQIRYKAYRAAVQSSQREIDAESAEREADKVKATEYMAQFLGESFSGKISGIIGNGLFVQLENLAEGFLPFSSMEGYYTFYEKELLVRDGGGQVRFRIGDGIRVRLVKAEILTGRLDFIIEEGNGGAASHEHR